MDLLFTLEDAKCIPNKAIRTTVYNKMNRGKLSIYFYKDGRKWYSTGMSETVYNYMVKYMRKTFGATSIYESEVM